MRSGIVIKPWCIQGQPIYSGYFELSGCSMIGQVWVTSIAVAISFDSPILYLQNAKLLSLSDDDDDDDDDNDVGEGDSGGDGRARICVVLMFPGGGRSSVNQQVFAWIGWYTMALFTSVTHP